MDRELTAAEVESGYLPLPTIGVEALEVVRYDSLTGLVPVVVQDVDAGHVLMLAYANREALKRTYGTGQAWFWSRSRQDYWRKGETSGHVLNVVEVRIDCDGDTVLYLVRPVGPACHTGETSCFYRQMTRDGAVENAATDVLRVGRAASPDEGQGFSHTAQSTAAGVEPISKEDEGDTNSGLEVLNQLWHVVESRWRDRPAGSYTTYLFEQGVDKSAKKLGEEAVEVVLAAKNAVSKANRDTLDANELATESADLLYHLMVLWKTCGMNPSDVYAVLAHRAK